MNSADRHGILNTPAAIDRSRYRVVIGEVTRMTRAVRGIGEVRLVGADSLTAAYIWLHDQLSPDSATGESGIGFRAAVVEVDTAVGTVGLVCSLFGPGTEVLETVSRPAVEQAAAALPDFSRPYRARLYVADDLITYESPPFASEAAARLWLEDTVYRMQPDESVEAGITRLDPILGWPRPVFEPAADRADFAATLLGRLVALDDADHDHLPGGQLIAGSTEALMTAHLDAERGILRQTSAADVFGETIYRDRLVHRLRTADITVPATTDPRPPTFPLRDLYRVRRDNTTIPTWDTVMAGAADAAIARALGEQRRFRFRDRADASRIIAVVWSGGGPGSSPRGWQATEFRDTAQGTEFVASLGRRDSGRQILDMLARPMTGFGLVTPTQRPPVDVPPEAWRDIFDLAARHGRHTHLAGELARQSATLRRPLALHDTAATTSSAGPGAATQRSRPTVEPWDFWRDGLFPGSRIGALGYNPYVWEVGGQGLAPARRVDRSTIAEDTSHREPGHRIAGLIGMTRTQAQALDLPAAESTRATPHTTPQSPGPGHEVAAHELD